MKLTIRPMARTDFDFALDLANREHWDYDHADLERLIRLFPDGCLIAEHQGVRAGWVIVSLYGPLAWIGSLVVKSDLRGEGIGRALLTHGVRYAHEHGVRTVGVYSYRQSEGFYGKMGFRHDCEFEHLEGSGVKASSRHEPKHPASIEELAEFDGRCFRGDRRLLLEDLHREFPNLMATHKAPDIQGYIAGKSFAGEAAEIGPWVCEPERVEVAEQLFTFELSQLTSKRISLTIPSQNSEAKRIVRKYGFHVKQRIVRMYLGDAGDLPQISGIYAAAGLDVG